MLAPESLRGTTGQVVIHCRARRNQF